MSRLILLTLLLPPLLLTGCATPKYACGVPDGIGCKPLSEVHRMARDGTLKMRAAPNNNEESQQKKSSTAQADVVKLAGGKQKTASDPEPELVSPPRIAPEIITITPGTPILTPPRTMRVWVARWPDEDETLHDETYLYLRLDNGQWLMK